MTKIIFASNNSGKIRELEFLFKGLPFTVVPQQTLHIPEVEETGLSFIENAIIKARHAAACAELPALADDSGLVIPPLNGAPGIFSARYAGEAGNAQKNIEKVLFEMRDLPSKERQAYFYCVLAFMMHANDPTPLICYGKWDGIIAETTQGKEGFGYDPIFFVPSENKTAAELTIERKNIISHRGQALHQLLQLLPERLNTYGCIAR